jgi:threonine/homoserine/homoserine lactone efflux protein
MLIGHSSLLLFLTGAIILLVIPGPAVMYDSIWALLAGSVASHFRTNVRLRRVQHNVSGGALIALGLATAFSGAKSK